MTNTGNLPDTDVGEETDPIAHTLTAARLYARAIEHGEHVPPAAALTMLGHLPQIRHTLISTEVALTEAALAGYTWDDVATATGRSSRHAARQWYRRWGGDATSPAGRPVDPVDVTPPELTPEAITRDGAPWWAEAAATPAEVTDWDSRIASAWIPYGLVGGMPINPHGPTGRIGRSLPRWGENQAVDAVVVAREGPDRQILLIQRDDTGTWALPGGMVDPGETDIDAMSRELHEETGVDLDRVKPWRLPVTYVEDHRASDHAWVVTRAGLYRLAEPLAPEAGDDATAAAWWPASAITALSSVIRSTGGQLHTPHRELIARALSEADDIER